MNPRPPEDILATAVKHHRANRLEDAEKLYRQILTHEPDHADAHFLLGTLLRATGRLEEAMKSLERAISLDPGVADYLNNLGTTLMDLGRLDDAEVEFRRAIQLGPKVAAAYANLGRILVIQNKPTQAIAACRQAVQLQPTFGFAHKVMAKAQRTLGQLEEAKKSLGLALQSDPYNASILNNAGTVLKDQAELQQAIECFRRAMQLNPNEPSFQSNLLHTVQFHPDFDGKAIQREQQLWNQRHAEPLKHLIKPHSNNRDPDRPLRVGYVSAYFTDHCQSSFMLPLLSNHDRSQVQVVCYSNAPRLDDLSARTRAVGHDWRDISRLSDDQAAQLIRDDRIDILVDLNMHMALNRLLVFARKPAPVQVTWLAYPGSTGMTAMDYRISDPHLDPPGLFDDLYSEKTIRLRDTFWCYDPLTDGPEVPPLPAMKSGQITFACLNHFSKVNDGVLDLWAAVLREVPKSRMLILSGFGTHRDATLEKLARQGITGDRIEFINRLPRQMYLELHQKIDLCLDTVPYNAHTTALDGMWMGVPTVSLVGKTAVGRAGLSLLTNLNMKELVAASTDDFVRCASSLANDFEKLGKIRAGLRERFRASPLMDGQAFAQQMESALRGVWQRWCKL